MSLRKCWKEWQEYGHKFEASPGISVPLSNSLLLILLFSDDIVFFPYSVSGFHRQLNFLQIIVPREE